MGDNLVKEEASGCLFRKIGVAGYEESVFGEFADKNEYGVMTLAFGEFSNEVHGYDFKWLIGDRYWL